jgi:hypothetical protein
MALHRHKPKSRAIVAAKMREVHRADPAKPRKQKIAIALSKARRAGAKVPKR